MHFPIIISISGVAFAGLAAAASIPGALGPRNDMKGGFVNNCWWTGEFIPRGQMYGTYTAQCPPPNANPNDGTSWETTLDLNSCLINHDGKMLWQVGGDAFGSCLDCNSKTGQTNIITCKCNSGGANPKNVSNTIDLNDGIYVTNNRLACFNVQGTLG